MDKSELLELNRQMERVFLQIENNKMPEESWKNMHDSLYFTPLHYALLLGKYELFQKLLNRKFRFGSKEEYQRFEKNNVHDLAFLAEYLETEFANDVFMVTSYEIKTIQRMLSLEKFHLKVQSGAIDANRKLEQITRKRIHAARKARNDWVYNEEQNRLYDIMSNRSELEHALYDIKNHLHDLEDELEDLIFKSKSERRKKVEEFRDSRNFFDMRIRELIRNPQILREIFCLNNVEWTDYFINGIRLAIPAKWIEAEKCDSKVFEQDIGLKWYNIEKPYGDKWFSTDAYHSREALKDEYRELAKKYHPDHFQYANAKEIFQDILSEKMEILESFTQT